jgi:3-oxoacyl-(acyl-carrier-protein) synthase
MAHQRRVVVTGLGVISPIGNDVDSFWRRLVAGESGVGEITRFDTTGYKVHIAAEVQGFVAEDYIDKRKARRLDLFSRYAVAAAIDAAADGGHARSSLPWTMMAGAAARRIMRARIGASSRKQWCRK